MLTDVRGARTEIEVPKPRIEVVTPFIHSAGHDVLEMAEAYGIDLDDWQKSIIVNALAETEDQNWIHSKVGLSIPRQQGKTRIIEAITLGAMLVLEEPVIIYTSVEVKSALEQFRTFTSYFENYDDLRRMAKVRNRAGYEEIELSNGSRLKFAARSKQGARGMSADRLILDESQELSGAFMDALVPTLAARPNSQIIMAGTAPAPNMNSEAFTQTRNNALAGSESGLYYVEFSAEDDADLDDEAAWRMANPALGTRLSEQHIRTERATLSDAGFARERLGMWAGARTQSVIPTDLWAERGWSELIPDNAEIALGIDVSPDRTNSTITVCARHEDKWHVEVMKDGTGVGWIPSFVAEQYHKRNVRAVVVDKIGASASLIEPLKNLDVPVTELTTQTAVQSVQHFYDLTIEDELRHFDQNELNNAIAGARKRKLAGGWVWNPQNAAVNITPLVAATNAVWGMTVASPAKITNTKKAPSISHAVYGFN